MEHSIPKSVLWHRPEADALTSPLSSPPPNIGLDNSSNVPTSPLSSPPSSMIFDSSSNADDDDQEEWSNSGDSDGESDGENDSDSSSDDTGTKTHSPGHRRRKKLQVIVDALRQVGWSFGHFVHIWIHENRQLDHRRYRTRQLRHKALRQTLRRIPPDIASIQLFPLLEKEIDHLIREPYFGVFDPSKHLEHFDFKAASESIQTTAPMWHKLLTLVLSNPRSRRKSYAHDQADQVRKRLFMLISVICHSRAKKRSNFFTYLVDAYLLGSGVKRRVIETLSGFGLCHSYMQGNRLMKKIAEIEKEQLQKLKDNPRAVIVYDNMNFKDTVHDEVLGHRATMRAMTTAAIVLCPDLPSSGLCQDMHDPTKKLGLHDYFDAPAICGQDDGIGVRISTSLISDAIRKVHPAVEQIFNRSQRTAPIMPEIDKIAVNKTKFWQFGAIYEDEGTIAGTYGVHDSIFLEQLQLHASESPNNQDDFSSRLWLVHGDQLTSHHIRTVKAEQTRAQRAYDRRDWLLGLPSWFHIQLNLLNTIVRTHFQPAEMGQEAHHCIQVDIAAWGRSPMTAKDPKYHRLEPLITQSFAARVLALFYTAMKRRGYFKDNISYERHEHIDEVLKKLDTDAYLQLVEDVRHAAFTLSSWRGVDPATREPIKDIEFRTMCRMLQEIELFLTVRHAVKHGDIGLLRYVVEPLTVFFTGASQHNYAYEMLYYRWNLSPVNTPDLQRAILASGLVNWQGKPTSHKAIDLGMEHLNGNCKIEMNAYKNSTHDIDITFNRVCLTNTWVRDLRSRLEETFGRPMLGTHTSASTVLEVFSLARSLFTSDLAYPRSAEQLAGRSSVFDSLDIQQLGMDQLPGKIEYFNDNYVYRPGMGPRINYDKNRADIDTHEYAEAIDEEFDGIGETLDVFNDYLKTVGL